MDQLLPGPWQRPGRADEQHPAKGHHQHPTRVLKVHPGTAAFASRSCSLISAATAELEATKPKRDFSHFKHLLEETSNNQKVSKSTHPRAVS